MGTRPRLGQVFGHAMVGAMRWQCRDDTGLPRTWLAKHVGDAVRETRGISVSLEISSSLLAGLVPRILWDRFRGFWAKEELHGWGTCTHSAESQSIRIAASSVMGHSSY